MRRLQHVGHCYRHRKEEVAGDLILWEPKHGKRNVGRPQLNYVKVLKEDVGCELDDMPNLMSDRDRWREIVGSRRNQSK